MSMTCCNHESPVRPNAEVNTLASELEARKQEEARRQEDSDKVVLEDEEYQGWVVPPEDEGMDAEDPLKKMGVPKVVTP